MASSSPASCAAFLRALDFVALGLEQRLEAVSVDRFVEVDAVRSHFQVAIGDALAGAANAGPDAGEAADNVGASGHDGDGEQQAEPALVEDVEARLALFATTRGQLVDAFIDAYPARLEDARTRPRPAFRAKDHPRP